MSCPRTRNLQSTDDSMLNLRSNLLKQRPFHCENLGQPSSQTVHTCGPKILYAIYLQLYILSCALCKKLKLARTVECFPVLQYLRAQQIFLKLIYVYLNRKGSKTTPCSFLQGISIQPVQLAAMAKQKIASFTSVDIPSALSSALVTLIVSSHLVKIFMIALVAVSQVLYLCSNLLRSRSSRKKIRLRRLSIDILLSTFEKSFFVPLLTSTVFPIYSAHIAPLCLAVTATEINRYS